MKNKLILSLLTFFLLNVGVFTIGNVMAGGCTEPFHKPESKNKLFSLSGCKDKPGHDCIIIRCPIIVK
ncbi:hypothetical protein [Mongoliitalea lutea]|uniref:Uncharacterized protein n=1 Tax=Mongoliitalea lutea TaxID=849756 RepID=A0A8J3CW45_9BACT|nr:hypothetical protein [Mongoliitalea lutea]GHB34197.1 hypothetical protein GCM10008106_14310 [Mongoliitalea lutea]